MWEREVYIYSTQKLFYNGSYVHLNKPSKAWKLKTPERSTNKQISKFTRDLLLTKPTAEHVYICSPPKSGTNVMIKNQSCALAT